MVDAHEMQNRGVKIMHMHSVFLGVHAELIARSVSHAAPDAATGEQHRECCAVVVPPDVLFVFLLCVWGATKFTAPDDQRVLKQASLL